MIHEPDDDGVGEVWARAPHSFLVDEQGWQHTGDLGRIVDGFLYLVGRRGDKIIRGGENVYPLEVEQVLALHPTVRDVIVVGVPDQRLGETIKAFVVPAGPAPDPEDACAASPASVSPGSRFRSSGSSSPRCHATPTARSCAGNSPRRRRLS